MRTIVYQSYRTVNVPSWINRCMDSVRQWATRQGFEYRFIDDRLFSYAPDWYRQRVNQNILLVSDLARLQLAKEFLQEGYSRTIWVDADVIIFAPQHFVIDITQGYAFCLELWIDPTREGGLTGQYLVNNAVTVFMKSEPFLGYYIDACQSIVKHKKELTKLSASTNFLTALYNLAPFNLLNQVGLFSPILMGHIAHHRMADVLQIYREGVGAPIYAANLCSSFRNTTYHGVRMTDDLYESVITNLLQG